jgi:PA14 domain
MEPPRSLRWLPQGRRRVLLAAAGAVAVGLAGPRAARSAQANPMAEAELARAARRGELCSISNATGTGLRGEYYAGEPGKGDPLLVRVDATVDFDPALEWPAQLAAKRPASARWSGWVKPPISGRYRFHADQNAARLVVARQVMAGPGAAADGSIELAAGRFYPITLEIAQLAAMTGRLRLEWTAPHGARYLVPRALLFLPSEAVPATKR